MKNQINNNRSFLRIKKIVFIATLVVVSNLIFTKTFAQQKPWATPKEAQAIKNPVAANTTSLAEGKKLYVSNCTPCHGDKGRGDGPAAQALVPKPADHSSALVQSETDGSLFWKLSQGRKPMPAYGKTLTEQQRWELVNYIRTLAKTPKK